jgi:hypothetical protein
LFHWIEPLYCLVNFRLTANRAIFDFDISRVSSQFAPQNNRFPTGIAGLNAPQSKSEQPFVNESKSPWEARSPIATEAKEATGGTMETFEKLAGHQSDGVVIVRPANETMSRQRLPYCHVNACHTTSASLKPRRAQKIFR